VGRPPSGTVSKYLLTGIGRCGVCGGGLSVRSGKRSASERWHRYVCATHHYRGTAMCANGLELRREVVEPALLSAIEGDILQPSVVERALGLALHALEADRPEARRVGSSATWPAKRPSWGDWWPRCRKAAPCPRSWPRFRPARVSGPGCELNCAPWKMRRAWCPAIGGRLSADCASPRRLEGSPAAARG
jgi:Recombinase zinc beta ribbon domain